MMMQFGYRYHGENQFPPSEWGKCVVGGRRTPERPNKTQHTASKTSQGRPSCHQPLITRVDALRRSHWTTRCTLASGPNTLPLLTACSRVLSHFGFVTPKQVCLNLLSL